MKNNIHNIIFGLLFSIIIIPAVAKSILIAIVLVYYVVLSIKNKSGFSTIFFLSFSYPFLFLLLTLFYSNNFSEGLKSAQIMSPLLIFPLIFSIISVETFKKINLEKLIWVYIIVIILFHVVVFIWFAITEFSVIDTIKHYQAIVTSRLYTFSIHPIYISIHCSIALILTFVIKTNYLKKYQKYILIFFQIALVLLLISHQKKGPFLALLISFTSIYLFFQIKIKKYYFLFFSIFVFFVIYNSNFKNRFLEVFTVKELSADSSNSTNIRYAIYKNTIQLINNAPYFGYGLGEQNVLLKKKYKENNQSILLEKEYNSHNQFFSFILIGGFFLFIIFLYFFLNQLYKSYLNKDKIYFSILLFYIIIMFTENILEREIGVVFFSFIICFLGFKNFHKINDY